VQESELLEQIGKQRRILNDMYKEYKDGMVKLSELKQELHQMLSESGLRSIKSANYGVSIVTKPKLSVQSEESVKEWLNNTPDIEPDAYIGLKLTPFKQMATQYFKDTGELIDGVEYSAEESLTIRENK
jgi:hypothetical protein